MRTDITTKVSTGFRDSVSEKQHTIGSPDTSTKPIGNLKQSARSPDVEPQDYDSIEVLTGSGININLSDVSIHAHDKSSSFAYPFMRQIALNNRSRMGVSLTDISHHGLSTRKNQMPRVNSLSQIDKEAYSRARGGGSERGASFNPSDRKMNLAQASNEDEAPASIVHQSSQQPVDDLNMTSTMGSFGKLGSVLTGMNPKWWGPNSPSRPQCGLRHVSSNAYSTDLLPFLTKDKFEAELQNLENTLTFIDDRGPVGRILFIVPTLACLLALVYILFNLFFTPSGTDRDRFSNYALVLMCVAALLVMLWVVDKVKRIRKASKALHEYVAHLSDKYKDQVHWIVKSPYILWFLSRRRYWRAHVTVLPISTRPHGRDSSSSRSVSRIDVNDFNDDPDSVHPDASALAEIYRLDGFGKNQIGHDIETPSAPEPSNKLSKLTIVKWKGPKVAAMRPQIDKTVYKSAINLQDDTPKRVFQPIAVRNSAFTKRTYTVNLSQHSSRSAISAPRTPSEQSADSLRRQLFSNK